MIGVWCALAGAALLVSAQTSTLVDATRNRIVPITIYRGQAPTRPAILSHGYGLSHTEYSFLANHLAARGYLVASVQHEIPGDAPLPSTGTPYETRMPSWRRGADNIAFVLRELKTRYPELDYSQLLLVGHSHGGDTSLLFARDHAPLVRAVISLDSRRMPFPRTARPALFTIRSSDQHADPGVLPPPDERAALGMRVVALPATRHDEMWDGATPAQRAEILAHVDAFLRELDRQAQH